MTADPSQMDSCFDRGYLFKLLMTQTWHWRMPRGQGSCERTAEQAYWTQDLPCRVCRVNFWMPSLVIMYRCDFFISLIEEHLVGLWLARLVRSLQAYYSGGSCSCSHSSFAGVQPVNHVVSCC